jgi:hypothetical protein
VSKSEHDADHARHREVTDRLDRVIALLERLVQAAGIGQGRQAGQPTVPSPPAGRRRQAPGSGPAAR